MQVLLGDLVQPRLLSTTFLVEAFLVKLLLDMGIKSEADLLRQAATLAELPAHVCIVRCSALMQ